MSETHSGENGPPVPAVDNHRCSECPDCGPPTDDRACAADGCEGLASIYDPFCTPECAEGRCPNCGQPRTAMACATCF